MSDVSSPRLPLLSGIRLAANGAFRFLYPFLPVVARDLGVPPARAGILVAAIAVGGMSSPLVRRLLIGHVDRTRRLLVLAAAVMTIGILVAAGAPGLVVAVVGFLVLGAGKPLLDVATIAYVSERTPYHARARATSVMELTWAGALVVVAPVAGVLAGWTSWRLPLALLGGAVLALALWGGRVLDPDVAGATEAAPSEDAGPMGATALRFLVVVALVFAALEATFAVFGLWLEDVFGASVEQLGAFAAITALGELGGSAFVMLFGDRVGKARAATAGLVICATGLFALTFATSLWMAVGALAFGLFGSEAGIVSTIPMASEVRPAARTRFLTVVFAAASLSRAVVAGVGPAIYTAVGIAGNVAMSIAAAAGAIALMWWTLRHEPQLRA